jgi:glycosyltransferase involved in cell wall biosynthesis
MNILIVYDNMYSWGGIQTLLVRFVPRLVAMGHEVTILTRPRGRAHDDTSGPLDALAQHAQVLYVDEDWIHAPASLRDLRLPAAHVIVACDLVALLLSGMIRRHRLPAARILIGVFAAREYSWAASPLKRRWERRLSMRFLHRAPKTNLMFTTDGMKRQTSETSGIDFSASPVMPIAIDVERLRPPARRAVDRRKVVTVARLYPYYEYHRQMIRVIATLRAKGLELEYHVHGEGSDRPVLEAEARRLGVEDAIMLHGAMPYERFAEAVGDAFAFIGLGTALLEAAACGVPSLVGIDSRRAPVTYGFLQDTTGNDVGSFVPGHHEFEIAERLEWLAGLSEAAYEAVGAASRARAEEFDVGVLVSRFERILQDTQPFSVSLTCADRVITWFDRKLAAVLRRFGVDTSPHSRHLRPLTADELRAGRA